MFGIKKLMELVLTNSQMLRNQEMTLQYLQKAIIDLRGVCEKNASYHGCSQARDELIKEDILAINSLKSRVLELKEALSKKIEKDQSKKPRGRPRKKAKVIE